jgi:hypothetical protein
MRNERRKSEIAAKARTAYWDRKRQEEKRLREIYGDKTLGPAR